MSCQPLRFGIDNHVELATLTASPAPETNLDWLKNEWRARRVVWSEVEGDIVITGTLSEPKFAEYIALPSSNLVGYATFKLELFHEDTGSTDLLNMEFQPVAEQIPLGAWRAGIDPYGVLQDVDIPGAIIRWFDPTLYDEFKLTIRHTEASLLTLDTVELRTLLIGNKLEVEKNFSYGTEITFMSTPDLLLTSSGSYIPVRGQRETRRLKLSLDKMTDRDRLALWRFESMLQNKPFIVSAYPSELQWQFNNYSFFARFANPIPFTHVKPGTHRTSLEFLET